MSTFIVIFVYLIGVIASYFLSGYISYKEDIEPLPVGICVFSWIMFFVLLMFDLFFYLDSIKFKIPNSKSVVEKIINHFKKKEQ